MTTQDVDLDLFISSVWTRVPLYTAAGTTITRGHDPGGSWPRPTRIDCEINNDSLNYDPARPQSLLYGVAGRNTQARVTVNGTLRTIAEASSWTPDRTPEHASGLSKGRSWTTLTAEGVLRRIGRWTDPLRSTMTRSISRFTTLTGFWPGEDDKSTNQLSNAMGGPAGSATGVTYGDSDAPGGGSASVKFSSTGFMTGQFVTASATAGWQVSLAFKLAAIPVSATGTTFFQWDTAIGYTWVLSVNNLSFTIDVKDSNGTSLLSSPVTFGTGVFPNQWISMRMKAAQSGGNIAWEWAWYVENASVFWGTSGSFAGTVSRPTRWRIAPTANNADAHYGFIYGVTTTADDLLNFSNTIPAFNGFTGERAYDRFFRLCAEQGITGFQAVASSASDTQKMGAQKSDTFLGLLDEIRKTDDCRIDDSSTAIGLSLRIRRAMYNQTASLTLYYPSQIAIPFTRVLDDQNTHNSVTVKNDAGGEATSVQTTGAMSTSAPPSGVGEYKQSVDVNVYDPANQLQNIADWWRAKGTLERPRYEEVTVDLLGHPELAAAATAVKEGHRITIVGAEPENVDLLVTGIVEKVGASEWSITFQTDLYDAYIIGVYDDGTWRWDTATTTLASGATATATSLALTTTNSSDVLTTAAGSIPYDLMVGGERVTVTAMTAAAGTGPYTQTATVTRAVNGVAKAQTAGTRVNVYNSRRWGL